MNVWPEDSIGTTALKVIGFCWFMASVYGAVQFLEIVMGR